MQFRNAIEPFRPAEDWNEAASLWLTLSMVDQAGALRRYLVDNPETDRYEWICEETARLESAARIMRDLKP